MIITGQADLHVGVSSKAKAPCVGVATPVIHQAKPSLPLHCHLWISSSENQTTWNHKLFQVLEVHYSILVALFQMHCGIKNLKLNVQSKQIHFLCLLKLIFHTSSNQCILHLKGSPRPRSPSNVDDGLKLIH